MPSDDPRSRGERSRHALPKKFARGVSGFLRVVLRILRQTGRGVRRLLRRPPVAFRVPRLALRAPFGDSGSARRSPEVIHDGLSAPVSQPVQSAHAPKAPSSIVLDGAHEPRKPADHLRVFDVSRPPVTGESALDVLQDTASRPEATLTSRGEARARLWRRRQTADPGDSDAPEEVSLAEQEVLQAVSVGPDRAVVSHASDLDRSETRHEILPEREETTHDTFAELPASTSEQPTGGKMTVEVTLMETTDAVAKEVTSSVPSPLVSAQPSALRRDRKTGKRKVVGRVVRRAPDRKSGEPAHEREAFSSGPADAVSPETGEDDSFTRIQNSGFAHAEGLLVERLAGNPRDLEAYRLLAQLYLGRNDFLQAKEVLEEALRRDPLEPSFCGPLGRAYLGLNQYSRALEMFQRAHNADEQNLEYLEPLLYIAGRMDHRSLVKVIAEKILALDPNHREARKHLQKVIPQS